MESQYRYQSDLFQSLRPFIQIFKSLLLSQYVLLSYEQEQTKYERRAYGARKPFPTSSLLNSALTLQRQFLLNISIFSTSNGYLHNSKKKVYILLFFDISSAENLLTPYNGKQSLHIYASPASLRSLNSSSVICFYKFTLCNYALILHFINFSEGNGHGSQFGLFLYFPPLFLFGSTPPFSSIGEPACSGPTSQYTPSHDNCLNTEHVSQPRLLNILLRTFTT